MRSCSSRAVSSGVAEPSSSAMTVSLAQVRLVAPHRAAWLMAGAVGHLEGLGSRLHPQVGRVDVLISASRRLLGKRKVVWCNGQSLEPSQVPLDGVDGQAGLAAHLALRVALRLHPRQDRPVGVASSCLR